MSVRGASSSPPPPLPLLESFEIFEILTLPKTHLFLTFLRFYPIFIAHSVSFLHIKNVHLTEKIVFAL